MGSLVPAAPWFAVAAAVVAAVACVAAWRALPWQGRQSVLVMAAAMLVTALMQDVALVGVLVGVVLLVSAMLGTVGVRGTPAVAECVHRAVIALVMAVCSIESAAAGVPADAVAPSGHPAHGGPVLSGVLPIVVTVGVVGVILWTIVAEWVIEPRHGKRATRLLAVESWALAAGLAVVCLAI